MKTIDVKQGSSEWLLLRYGIPTASGAENIITPAKGERTKETRSDAYISELIAERHAKMIHGADAESIARMLNRVKTDGMVYGNEMEPRAANAYELITGNETRVAGFMTNDAGITGASLDRLVSDKGGLEIKCPFSYGVHVANCLSRSIEIDKRPQLQWQLWVSGLEWIDVMSFYPGCPITPIVRAIRDETYITLIAMYHAEFAARLEERWTRFLSQLPEPPGTPA